MQFQVLSHAGLNVTGAGISLICDPWIVGSCYWRSWWNYPPVSRPLVESLAPSFVYLTHVHWDHFQGPSLRKFPKTTPILVPKGNYSRVKRDLVKMGYKDVRELRHGKTIELAPGFKVTSYQFSVFLDSAIVIECDGVVLLNANDAKFMGLPFKQILRKHPKIDFVLRSHSSANSRLNYEITDDASVPVDDNERYIDEFARFAVATKARYAIPFASNHCHLHKDVYHFNQFVRTPQMVADYFRAHGIERPEVRVMVSGDAWSSEGGFEIAEKDWFADRDGELDRYRQEKQPILDEFYRKEERANVRLADMQEYFQKLFKATPFFLRWRFKGHPSTWVLTSGERRSIFQVDIYNKTVVELDSVPDDATVIETSAFIMKQCLKIDLFSHLSISKRVKYRVTTKTKKYVEMLNLLFNLYEYDWLPMRRMFRPRVFETYALRWREMVLYMQLLKDVMLTGKLNTDKYMTIR